jgi:hypothetical protein
MGGILGCKVLTYVTIFMELLYIQRVVYANGTAIVMCTHYVGNVYK